MNLDEILKMQKEAFESFYKTDITEAANVFKLNTPADLFDYTKYSELLSNNIKFHNAMIAYNQSLKDMYDVIEDNKKILLKK
jgi:hypothetical protein